MGYVALPESVILDSITCLDDVGKSLPFRFLSKHNSLEIKAKEKVVVSFLFSSLSWKCNGHLYVTNKNLQFHVTGQITNTEEETLSGAVTLVTGRQNDVHLASRERSMAKMSVDAFSQEPREAPLEDYHQYNVGDLSLAGASTAVIPLGNYSFPYAKVYLVKSTQNEVSYGYRLLLDDYIPSCNLTIYKDNLYLGSTVFEEARQGDERVVLVGQSSQVRCRSSVVTLDEELQDTIDENTIKTYTSETITCELFNHTSEEVTILVEHPLRSRNIEEISPEPHKIENGVARWEVKLKKKGKFEATVLYYNILHLEKQV